MLRPLFLLQGCLCKCMNSAVVPVCMRMLVQQACAQLWSTNAATAVSHDAWEHAELWNPATEKFTAMAIGAAARTYHSVALLLQDGRVFSGGGGLCGTCGNRNHFNGQIWCGACARLNHCVDMQGTAMF
jgi:hypothetical protein